MINLIPPEGHVVVRREYHLRVGGTLCLLFAGVLLFLCAALVPTYVLLKAQVHSFGLEAERNSQSNELLAQTKDEVALVQQVIVQLKKSDTEKLLSAALQEIEERKPTSIIIKTIQFEYGKDGAGKIQITGEAETRGALAQFRRILETDGLFAKADIPISDLVREVDLPFVMTLTLRK